MCQSLISYGGGDMETSNNIIDRLGKCITEDERREFDNLLRAMFCNYMTTVLSHECLHFNNTRKYKPLLSEPEYVFETAICKVELVDFETKEITNLQDFINSFENEKLLRCFKRLSCDEQMLLYMKFVCEYTDQEIASKLSKTRQCITRRKNNILHKLFVGMESGGVPDVY